MEPHRADFTYPISPVSNSLTSLWSFRSYRQALRQKKWKIRGNISISAMWSVVPDAPLVIKIMFVMSDGAAAPEEPMEPHKFSVSPPRFV